ncbi:hypothetical protein DFS34DRAFT_193801 [Phlyctochytrium arcticum]|nr:hypothetical protein DFS34DRAFT_193801 [Phlyctochytrium arcticum]
MTMLYYPAQQDNPDQEVAQEVIENWNGSVEGTVYKFSLCFPSVEIHYRLHNIGRKQRHHTIIQPAFEGKGNMASFDLVILHFFLEELFHVFRLPMTRPQEWRPHTLNVQYCLTPTMAVYFSASTRMRSDRERDEHLSGDVGYVPLSTDPYALTPLRGIHRNSVDDLSCSGLRVRDLMSKCLSKCAIALLRNASRSTSLVHLVSWCSAAGIL